MFDNNAGNMAVVIKVCDYLSSLKIGDYVTDEKLKEIAGVDLSSRAKKTGLLYKAIRECMKKTGLVWKREFGAGAIKCLDDRSKSECIDRKKDHLRKTSRNAIKMASTVDITKLDPSEAHNHVATVAQLSMVGEITSTVIHRKLIARGTAEIPKDKLLAIFNT